MAENIVLNPVTSFTNDSSAVSIVNGNNQAIESAFQDVLARSGGSPNTMQANLDMNSNQIINLPAPSTLNSPLRLVDGINGTITLNVNNTTVDITNFGGNGNGIADNATAFAAAMATLGSGGTIYFPPGTYYSSTAYNPKSNINIQGAGMGATFLVGNPNASGGAPHTISVIVFGQLTGTTQQGITGAITYPVNTPTAQANTITTTSPADALNFAAGNTVLISGGLHGTNFWYPCWETTVVSADSGTGIITLAEPIPGGGYAPNVTLIQKIVTYVTNVKISDLTILSTFGNLIVSIAKDVLVERVAFLPGAVLGSPYNQAFQDVTGSACRNVTFRDCLATTNIIDFNAAFDSVVSNCYLNNARLVMDGGAQNCAFIGNTVTNPSSYGTVESGLSVVADANNNRLIGNMVGSVGNVAAIFLGLDNDHTEGNNVITNNIITGDLTSTTGIACTKSANNIITNNIFYGIETGMSFDTNSSGQILNNNKLIGFTTAYSFDATSGVIGTGAPATWVGTNGVATPSVESGYLSLFNGSPQNITNFTNGSNGQIIYIYFGTGNSTLVFGGSMQLRGDVNYNPPSNTMMSFVNNQGVWWELTRTQAALSPEIFAEGVNIAGALVVTGGISATGLLQTAASTTGSTGLNIPAGTAPTSPVNGDLWFDGTNVKIQVSGVTKTFTIT